MTCRAAAAAAAAACANCNTSRAGQLLRSCPDVASVK